MSCTNIVRMYSPTNHIVLIRFWFIVKQWKTYLKRKPRIDSNDKYNEIFSNIRVSKLSKFLLNCLKTLHYNVHGFMAHSWILEYTLDDYVWPTFNAIKHINIFTILVNTILLERTIQITFKCSRRWSYLIGGFEKQTWKIILQNYSSEEKKESILRLKTLVV